MNKLKKYISENDVYMKEGGFPERYKKLGFSKVNQVKNAPQGDSHKKMVVAKKGDKYKLVKFGLRGMEDYTQHHDKDRRKNYLSRSAGIRNGSGQLTKNDVFSANHWSRKVLWQTGGEPNNLTIIEDGEYVKDNQGKVGKITNIPTHDDNELIIDNQVKSVAKGKGGQGIYNVESVLSNSYNGEGSTNRNKSDDTYTYKDEEVTLKPQEALQLAEQLNLKIKRPLGSISPSKLMDKLLESRENLVRKYKDIDKPLKSERQTNSFTANVDVLSSIPTPEAIYDFIFSNQENSKSENQELYAKTGIHIDPSKRGTFKAAASRYGMSMDALATDAKQHPEKYSGILRKKANFYRNFAKQTGGLTDLEIEDLEYQTGGLRKPQQDLVKWTNQKWRTNSGKKSSETGERYLPDKAWDNLSSEEKARTNRAKREGGGTGNNVPQPKDIANKTSKYRTAQTGIDNDYFKSGGSTVNSAGNYTKPEMRKRLFNRIKNEASMGTAAGQWSARKAQKLARLYKENGGGYRQQGGRLQQFPTMYGSKPVALVNTPQGVKRVDMIDNRTVSMDDMFNKDSVQVQGNKAVIIKKNPLKKYVR